MAKRKLKELKAIPSPVQPILEKLLSADLPDTVDIPTDDKKGIRTYGEERVENVLREVDEQLPHIDGRMGLSEEAQQKMRDRLQTIKQLGPAIANTAQILEILQDTKHYHLHYLNLDLEILTRSLDDKPAYADRFPLLLEHVRSAGKKGAKTRQENLKEEEKKKAEEEAKKTEETPV